MENIYSAAIWYVDLDLPTVKYRPENITTGVVVEGHRHADIIRTLLNLTGLRTVEIADDAAGKSIQGFVTNKNRFVNRVAGKAIAKNANQLIEETGFNELYSEDIY